jgi:hypothetical protein
VRGKEEVHSYPNRLTPSTGPSTRGGGCCRQCAGVFFYGRPRRVRRQQHIGRQVVSQLWHTGQLLSRCYHEGQGRGVRLWRRFYIAHLSTVLQRAPTAGRVVSGGSRAGRVDAGGWVVRGPYARKEYTLVCRGGRAEVPIAPVWRKQLWRRGVMTRRQAGGSCDGSMACKTSPHFSWRPVAAQVSKLPRAKGLLRQAGTQSMSPHAWGPNL